MTQLPSTAGKELRAGIENEGYQKAAAKTLASIHEAIASAELTFYSNRSLAEVEALKEEVAAVIPAGNVVGLVLSGLVRLRGRTLPADQAKSDVSALLRAVEILPRNILPKIHYGTFFAGPAAVLSAYQKLLTLAGKDMSQAFPDGLWQFYLEFAMREDSARHTNETTGFQSALANHGLKLSPMDQLAAWVCAVSQIYFQYDELLHNEWRERVYLKFLEQTVAEANVGHRLSFRRLPQAWAVQRPYRRGRDARHDESYPLYRRRRFEDFLQNRLDQLPEADRNKLEQAYAARAEEELAAYQKQMTILARLDPERYRDNRIPVSLWQARIGVIYQGNYYLLPACQTDPSGRPLLFEGQQPQAHSRALHPKADGQLYDQDGHLLHVDRQGRLYQADTGQLCGYLRPAHFQAVRRQIAAIYNPPASARAAAAPAGLDDQLIAIGRTEQAQARRQVQDEAVQQALDALTYSPVIINWDRQAGSKPLASIRRGKRGIGDHALTIFLTDRSMVFDQSHIFFDGAWGMALSEILTGEAVSWAAYFDRLEPPEPANETPYRLQFPAQPALEKFSRQVAAGVSAENSDINMPALYKLRKLLPKRHPDLKLTVNDLLILYRCEFRHDYRPSSKLKNSLAQFRKQGGRQAQEIAALIDDLLAKLQTDNPALVIPMDASATSPRERMYPTTFRNPFTELWGHYQQASKALSSYTASQSQPHWAVFTDARRMLLIRLNYFGELLRAYKRVALGGGSTSTATLKLLAHLPPYVLKLLDEIPRRIDILNEVIKGDEAFSNGGRVAQGSSLSRFISAKDDNENKTLIWAVLTDDDDVMHLSLRDFRPHTTALRNLDRVDLAEMIVTDYLDSYVAGFNQFVARLLDILQAKATHSVDEVA